MFDSIRVDNIPEVPIVCEGPEGKLLAQRQLLIHAKLSGHMGVLAETGAGLGAKMELENKWVEVREALAVLPFVQRWERGALG